MNQVSTGTEQQNTERTGAEPHGIVPDEAEQIVAWIRANERMWLQLLDGFPEASVGEHYRWQTFATVLDGVASGIEAGDHRRG